MEKLTRRERKKKKRKRFLAFIIFLFLVSFIILYSLKSTFFNIDGFKVRGNKELTTDHIIQASMIQKGDNIFKINKRNALDKMENLAYVKSVSLNRKLPKKIEIDIIERIPVLYLQRADVFLAIDEEGVILEEIDENQEKYPVFMGLNMKNRKIGDNMFSSQLSNGIIDFIEETLSLKLLDIFDKVDFKTEENINIQLKDGIYVAFGDLDNVKYKLRLLDEVLKDSREKNIKFTKIIMNKGANPILVTED